MPKPTRILFHLRGGYGLGDAVQWTIILKHLRKYRPDWRISVQIGRGLHSAFHGLCHKAVYEDQNPADFDQVVDLDLEDSYVHFADRPSSKTVFNLRLQFGLDYDPECGGYEIRVHLPVMAHAERWLRSVAKPEIMYHNGEPRDTGLFRAVFLHYRGGSSKQRKDIEHWQAEVIVNAIRQSGRTPILLDWSDSPLDAVRVPDKVWGGFGNGDAEIMAAMIRQGEAFVGIDSGPGKVASATDTPSLIVWTKHHPARYHDPAENTEHLIPSDWRGMQPIEWDIEREKFFEANYHYRTYQGEHGMVGEVVEWLRETLHWNDWQDPGVTFVVPGRLESAVWVMAKIRNIAGKRKADCVVCREPGADEAAEFLRSFGFFRTVKVGPLSVHHGPEKPQNTRGHYLYVSDGQRDGYHWLVPDAVMQLGKPLSDWLPEVPADFEMVQNMGAKEWLRLTG